MNCNKCHNTGYTYGIKIICGCLPSADERADIITITRDGYPPLAISTIELRHIFNAAEHDRPALFYDNDIGVPLMKIVGMNYDKKRGFTTDVPEVQK